MYLKRILSPATTVLLLMVVFACFFSCSDVDDEGVTERLRFTEFFLLPTAPYYRKSYIEHIPDEEVSTRQVDFEAKIAAIQEVYTAFIKAYREEDMSALTKTLDVSGGLSRGMKWGPASGWNNIKSHLTAVWIQTDCEGIPNWENWELTDFYIRPKYIKVPWEEASATGPMFFQETGSFECVVRQASFYLTKKSVSRTGRSDSWRIHHINGSRITDPKYKVPVPQN